MKTIVDIHMCNCGVNIILLNDNFEDMEDTFIDCPVCGEQIDTFMTREVEIKEIGK